MDRKLFFTLVVSLLLGAMLYVLYLIFQPFISSLLWAGVLVTLTYPLYRRLLNQWPQRSDIVSLLMCIGLTLLLVLPATLLLLILFKDLAEGAQSLSASLQHTDYRTMISFDHPIFQQPLIQKIMNLLGHYVDWESIDLRAGALNGLQKLSQFMVERSRGFFSAFSSFFFVLAMVEVNMFFLFRDGHRFVNFVKHLIPIPTETKEMLLQRMREVIRASMYGSVGTAAVQGVVGGLGFLALGVPSAVFWSVIMMIMGFLPLAGPFLVWAPAAVYLLVKGSWIKALLLVVWGIFVVGTIDNILRPLLIRSVSSKENQLNTLVLFLSVLGGIRIFGFLGIVLAPLLIVLFLTLLEILSSALGSQEGTRLIIPHPEEPQPPQEESHVESSSPATLEAP